MRATARLTPTPRQMGITFIGPNETSMFLLGDKIASTIIAQSAGVPCISWSGSGVDVAADADGKVPLTFTPPPSSTPPLTPNPDPDPDPSPKPDHPLPWP